MPPPNLQYSRIATPPADLTTKARIRNAALEAFANQGIAATSIRSVARDAGVSAGLVQHHFPTKDALRGAVNDHVVAIARDAFADLSVGAGASAENVQKEIGDRITGLVRDHPAALRYVARAAADGDESALELFDAFVGIAEEQWRKLDESGYLRSGADLTWAALHVVVLNLATLIFEPAIDRHLTAPFRTPEQLERWNLASNALFREGMYRH
jgi:AcrR family transcriptional regulator